MIRVFALQFVFALLDVLVYPRLRSEHITVYRVAQHIILIGLALAAYFLFGLRYVIVFAINHWCFLNDFLYYLMYPFIYGGTINPFSSEHVLQADCRNGMRHAHWTPIGIIIGLTKGWSSDIPCYALYIQAIYALVLGFLILGG